MKDVTDQKDLDKRENQRRIEDTTFFSKCGDREEEPEEDILYKSIRDSIENPVLRGKKQVRGFSQNNL